MAPIMTNDGENLRTITADGHPIVHLRRLDPHGLWYINLDKGRLPKMLEGAYTSHVLAYDQVVNYFNQRTNSKEP